MTWTTDQILAEVKVLDDQVKGFKQELFKICWYMRGSVTLNDAYLMSAEDRELVAEIIKENLDTTKKSGMPFF